MRHPPNQWKHAPPLLQYSPSPHSQRSPPATCPLSPPPLRNYQRDQVDRCSSKSVPCTHYLSNNATFPQSRILRSRFISPTTRRFPQPSQRQSLPPKSVCRVRTRDSLRRRLREFFPVGQRGMPICYTANCTRHCSPSHLRTFSHCPESPSKRFSDPSKPITLATQIGFRAPQLTYVAILTPICIMLLEIPSASPFPWLSE